MHVVLAVEELNGVHGGVERTVANLANYLNAAGHRVTLLTLEPPASGEAVYPLAPEVQRVCLGLRPATPLVRLARNTRHSTRDHLPRILSDITRNVLALGRIWSVRRREIPVIAASLKSLDADVIVSFKTHFHRYILPAAALAGIPAVASEHNPPEVLYSRYLCAVDRWVTRKILTTAKAIRVLLPDFIAGYPENLRDKCAPIANGIVLPRGSANPGETTPPFTILHIGRLYFQKDQATLIKAFATLSDRYPDWRVKIYGDGEFEDDLKRLIREHGLQQRVLLMGPVDDVTAVYQKSHVFVLPSLFEGFGNVTLEAMANGLPVLAFDNVAANRLLIFNERTGILVPSGDRVQSLAKGLERLMADAALRARLGAAARLAAKRFDQATIFNQWESLLLAACMSPKDTVRVATQAVT
jgi:glycosyltransferase involved in cell wall biosynthesis